MSDELLPKERIDANGAPCYAVFYTLRLPPESGDCDRDHYEILDGAQEARTRYRELLEDQEHLYCAGYGPVTNGTEPQWREGL